MTLFTTTINNFKKLYLFSTFLKITDIWHFILLFSKIQGKSEILTPGLDFFPLLNKTSPTVVIISEGFVLLVERGGCLHEKYTFLYREIKNILVCYLLLILFIFKFLYIDTLIQFWNLNKPLWQLLKQCFIYCSTKCVF